MNWPWGSSSSSKDPLSNVDPKVRDFLLKESPIKPIPSTTAAAAADPNTTAATTSSSSSPSAAEKSAYGTRYTEYWSNYTPLTIAEELGKPPQEKLKDALSGYKYRNTAIGRAALENCSNEQWELHDCFKNGSLGKRLVACSDERRKLEECYVSQAKFLRALGYMMDFERSPEVDEQIQMHADRLYQEQVRDDNAAAEESKRRSNGGGNPSPSSPSSSGEDATTAGGGVVS